jgi:serine/threonine-protein kinase PknG
VRRIDDEDSAIFGTVGYQAPEVAEQGCTVASDIYTIGRTLVVLTMEFRGYQTTYVEVASAAGGRADLRAATTRSTGSC